MQHALFEVLTGHYANGDPVTQKISSANVQKSIVDSLTRLLNARQGALVHLPDFGLPDIAAIYSGLPYTITDLTEIIRKTILKYEPRLSHVRVDHKAIDTREFVLQLKIVAKLHNGENVIFDTFFLSSGNAEVKVGNGRHI